MHFVHMFETCVGPLDTIGVKFRHRGNIAGNRETQTRDSDHTECEGVSGVDSAL